MLESFFDKVSSLQPAGFLEDSNTSQGRRKLFYGGGGGGGGGKKKKRKHWLKRPRGLPKTRKLNQNINYSKSHI